MDTVKEYKIQFYSRPFQSKITPQPIVSRKGKELVKLKVREMLKKGATRKVQSLNGEFASNLFPVKKKMGFKNQV